MVCGRHIYNPIIDKYNPGKSSSTIDTVLTSQPDPQIVTPEGHVCLDNQILKVYSLFGELPGPLYTKVLRSTESQQRVLFHLLHAGKIRPQKLSDGTLISEGVAMISEEVINVVLWGNREAYLIKQIQIRYDPEKDSDKLYHALVKHFNSRPTYKRLNPNQVGPFCAYEMQIMAFESLKWLKYLPHLGDQKRKEEYLETFCKGAVVPGCFDSEEVRIPLKKAA